MTQYQSKSKGHKEKDPNLELSVGQVLAAAGATVLGAVLAKLLNLWGTIPGTAFLSVFSAIGSVLILRAIRRTGDRVKAQIQAMAPRGPARGTAVTVELDPNGTGNPGEAKATAKLPGEAVADAAADSQGTDEQGEETTATIPAPEPATHVAKSVSGKRTLLAILVSSVLVFAITVGALYLLGALAGEPDKFISNNPETTIIETHVESENPDPTSTSVAPTESASPSDQATSESPSASTSPSESATTESPSESPTPDAGSGGSEPSASPTPQDGTVTESPGTE